MHRDEARLKLTHRAIESESEERGMEGSTVDRRFNAESTQYFSIRNPETH